MAKPHPENGAAELLLRPVRVPWACLFALALTLALVNARPACASSPTATLEAFFGRANTILASVDPERGLGEPRQAIRDLVNEVFEFRGAGALVLGSVWLSRAPDDQDEFVRLFASVLERGFVAAISSKASLAGGVRIQYLGESVAGDSATVATTILTRTGSALPVDYWLVRRGERWKVQDVVIDGVSLLANYRAQFRRVLAVHPYTELVARMHTAETRAAYVRCLAIRRYGTPGEVAGAALFLASDGARYVTGEVLHVDGGFTAAGVMF